MSASPLPPSLAATPILARWLRFEVGGTVTLFSGKVEIGQGIGAALRLIAAEELDIPPDRIVLVAGDTASTPDEGWTSASISIEVGGGSVRLVCAEARALFQDAAAVALGVPPDAVELIDGVFWAQGRRTDYWTLAPTVTLEVAYAGRARPRAPADYRWVGRAPDRPDLAGKIGGAPFIHDLDLPAMLHGRILRPPRPGCRLVRLDTASIESRPGVAAVVIDGSFVGVCAEREDQAIAAVKAAGSTAVWSDGPRLPDSRDASRFLRALPSVPRVVLDTGASTDDAPIVLSATYSKPYIAHASIGLCCALALAGQGELTVWSQTQGVYPLRAALAEVFGLALDAVRVIHADGAGCYGHNGADDVALDAALLARATGRPVRVVWSREDELAWSPLGSAMVMDLTGAVDAAGRIVRWTHDVYSTTHLSRPGWGKGINLLAAQSLEVPFEPSPTADPQQDPFGGGGDRNAIPLYDLPSAKVVYHLVTDAPVRTSALRSLGGFGNVLAIESFMDELAAASGLDPLDIRLNHLSDPRAKAVLTTVAQAAGWIRGAEGDGVHGRGLGFAQYKNKGAYCAVIADLSFDEDIRVTKLWAAVEAGLIIDPDGLRNQIEGGLLQALSWTLKEEVRFHDTQIETRSWADYPILRFDEVPELEVILLDRPDLASKGVGECAAGPVAGAVANAIAQGLGIRVRTLPITRDRIIASAAD